MSFHTTVLPLCGNKILNKKYQILLLKYRFAIEKCKAGAKPMGLCTCFVPQYSFLTTHLNLQHLAILYRELARCHPIPYAWNSFTQRHSHFSGKPAPCNSVPLCMELIAPRNAIPTFQENQHAAIPIPYASKSCPLQSSQGSHGSRARLLLQSARRGLS